ncbi:MAG: YggT family protein [candidate division WOR-3 bacterium]|nr:YggT family protein [candidate division WOR-3 bacterium]MCX7947457.1 YggT family protein [candidate division WOR-3 bacterium]MDW8150616.1 YggT family protein [candidate division WOR-3 bacterium]
MENILVFFIDLYSFVILVSAILSWFEVDRTNKVVKTINDLADIILNPIRKLIFEKLNWSLPIDISPIIAIILLQILSSIIRLS